MSENNRKSVTSKQAVQIIPENSTALPTVVEAGFWERFSWNDFFCYGSLWCVMFFTILCVSHVVQVYRDQQRQIQNLIDRLHRYENPDYSDQDTVIPPDYEDGTDKENSSSLASWVKANIPKDGEDEREAVAEVFSNLADMLEDGTLKGEKDAFSEGITQLQPVATRRIWLPFLTKLTKKLQKQHLNNKELASSFRVISKSINPKRGTASQILLESIKPYFLEYPQIYPSDVELGVSKQSIKEEEKPSQNQAEEPIQVENGKEPVSDLEIAEKSHGTEGKTSNCPNGNCQYPGSQSGYYWRYF